MPTEADPIVSNWYQHFDKGQKFRVVALDDIKAMIEIQYFDGDLDEIDQDDWYLLDIEPIAPPENWTGALDIAEQDDLGTSVTDTTNEDWSAHLKEIKTARRDDGTEPAEEETNDWGEGMPEEELQSGEQEKQAD